MLTKLISLILSVMLPFFLTGCSAFSDFDHHKHALTILSMKTADDFNTNRKYILEHTSDDLKDEIMASCSQDRSSRGYNIFEKNAWVETVNDETHVMIESLVTTNVRGYILLSYYTYKGNKLVSYKDTKMADIQRDMGEF